MIYFSYMKITLTTFWHTWKFLFQFVAHPNVQQLLASIWYEGLPGFRRKNMALQALEIVKIGLLFPLFSIVYIIAPRTSLGSTMRKPFIKFICHSASYFTFLCKYNFFLFFFLLLLAWFRLPYVAHISECAWFWLPKHLYTSA